MDKNDEDVNPIRVATMNNFNPKMVNLLRKEFPNINNLNFVTNKEERIKIILEKMLNITNYNITDDGIVVNENLLI